MKELKFTELSEDQLREFINICTKEIVKRQDEKRERLINNLKKAFEELEREGIEIYLDYNEEIPIEFNDLRFY